jgi:hypothetical protein
MDPEYVQDESALRSTMSNQSPATPMEGIHPSVLSSGADQLFLDPMHAAFSSMTPVSNTASTSAGIDVRETSVDTNKHAGQGNVASSHSHTDPAPRWVGVRLELRSANRRQNDVFACALGRVRTPAEQTMNLDSSFMSYGATFSGGQIPSPASQAQPFRPTCPPSIGHQPHEPGFQVQFPQVPLPQYIVDPTHWHVGLEGVETSQETPTTATGGTQVQPALNSLPADKVSYGPYSGRFTTLNEVRGFENRVRWRPVYDDVLPSTDAEVLTFVERVYAAIVDFSGFHDKIESRNKLNRLVSQRYSQEEIEAQCWLVVVSTFIPRTAPVSHQV